MKPKNQPSMSRADELRAELAGLRAKAQDGVQEVERLKNDLSAALLAGNDARADALEVQLADALKAAGRAEVREQGLLQAVDAAEREANASQRAAIAAELADRMAERAALVDGIAERLDALAAELEAVRDNTLQGRFWSLLELHPTGGEIPNPPSFGKLHKVARRIALAAGDVSEYVDDLAGNCHRTREIANERARRGTSAFDESCENEAFIAANPIPELPRITLGDMARSGAFIGIMTNDGTILRTTEPAKM
ncbi:hypothetical protein [Crenobacter caeni]|uniref:Uncharacterized protein n=1 Tax=Crenobacter caeni TaxID=2705474 RepID=A0A6B2KU36_9NEIS|nr:hypothetical protein [Crenobacter caeni]NDV13756.1 hypothetical protein [Crenobacter caeni]